MPQCHISFSPEHYLRLMLTLRKLELLGRNWMYLIWYLVQENWKTDGEGTRKVAKQLELTRQIYLVQEITHYVRLKRLSSRRRTFFRWTRSPAEPGAVFESGCLSRNAWTSNFSLKCFEIHRNQVRRNGQAPSQMAIWFTLRKWCRKRRNTLNATSSNFKTHEHEIGKQIAYLPSFRLQLPNEVFCHNDRVVAETGQVVVLRETNANAELHFDFFGSAIAVSITQSRSLRGQCNYRLGSLELGLEHEQVHKVKRCIRDQLS